MRYRTKLTDLIITSEQAKEILNIISHIEQRRLNIISKMWSNGPMNPSRLGVILKGITNAEISITENTGKNRFTVYINTTPYKADNTTVNKTLDKLKPAHLIYHTVYSTKTCSNLYIAGVIQKSKIITLPTIDAIYRKTLNGALNTGGVLQYSKSITLKEG